MGTLCRQELKIYSNTPSSTEEQLITMTKASGANKEKHSKPIAIQKRKTKQCYIMGGGHNSEVVFLEGALQHVCDHHVTEHDASLYCSTSL